MTSVMRVRDHLWVGKVYLTGTARVAVSIEMESGFQNLKICL